MSGTVVDNRTRAPVGGAELTLTQAGATTVRTDDQGRFSVPSLPGGVFVVRLEAPGYLLRSSRVSVTQSRTNVEIDVISTSAPFDLEFYRQFVRHGYDSEHLAPLRRWTMNPSFYLRSITEDTHEPIPVAVLEGVRRVLMNSVPELSAGLFVTQEVEIAQAPPPTPRLGWVNVQIYRHQFGSSPRGGDATVGGNYGTIRLLYEPDERLAGLGLGCGSFTVEAADHEVVHTMGFGHTAQTLEDFQSGHGCPGLGRPDRVGYHAAIAYSRPPGNRDPDFDPSGFATPWADTGGAQPVVVCRFPERR